MSSQTSSKNIHHHRSSACGGGRSSTPFNSLAEIVDNYIEIWRPGDVEEEKNWQGHSSLKKAVETAALSRRKNGKKHEHQRRIANGVLQDAAATLIKVDFSSVCNFEELHQTIENSIGSIKGIGELAVYDISCRIGTFLHLSPDAVYIHCGTREGAEALLGRRVVADKLEKCELPKEFDRLSPAEIENCLCIYKKDIARLKSSERGCRTVVSGV